MDRASLETRYVDLTQIILPTIARFRHWPVTESHALTNIVLDHLFRDRWTNHVAERLRTHRKLNDTQLAQAVAIAEKMGPASLATVRKMHQQSLAWRNEKIPLPVDHHRLHGVEH